MKHFFVAYCILAYSTLTCQQSVNSGGSIYSYPNNDYSYSIGQTFSEYYTPANQLFTQGVQHPVFLITSLILNSTVNNKITVYPNPISNYLFIDFDNLQRYNIKLYNNLAQIVFEKETYTNLEKIQLLNLVNSAYFLNIYQDEKLIYTTKIIKNE